MDAWPKAVCPPSCADTGSGNRNSQVGRTGKVLSAEVMANGWLSEAIARSGITGIRIARL
jgi:hypothetical protein